MASDEGRMPVTDDQNAFLMIGQAQGAIKALEDRQGRHEERFDAFLVENAHASAATTATLGTIVAQLNVADGRSRQRIDDTARLSRRVGWLLTLTALLLTLLGIFVEGHVHFYGN